MLKRVSPICACVLAALCSMNATAAERSASVTFEFLNFGFQLIDLNPGDGIAPSLQIHNEELGARTEYNDQVNPRQAEEIDHYGTVSLASTFGSASSTLTPTSSKMTATVGGSPYAQSAGGTSGLHWSFTLSPFTAMVFNATVSLTGSATDETGHWSGYSLLLGSLRSGYDYSSEIKDSALVGDRSGVSYLSGYLDTLDQAATGDLYLHGRASAYLTGPDAPPLPPVPEPETYAMLLAGLGVLGAAARRRRHRAASPA